MEREELLTEIDHRYTNQKISVQNQMRESTTNMAEAFAAARAQAAPAVEATRGERDPYEALNNLLV